MQQRTNRDWWVADGGFTYLLNHDRTLHLNPRLQKWIKRMEGKKTRSYINLFLESLIIFNVASHRLQQL